MGQLDVDYEGAGAWLNSPQMAACMVEIAQDGQKIAESFSPDAPPYGEGYKQSWFVVGGTHGGAKGDRAFAVLGNFALWAMFVEYGNGTETGPKHHTIVRTLDMLRLVSLL